MPKNKVPTKSGIHASAPRRFDPVKLFIVLVAASAAIYLIISIIFGNGKFADIFFLRCSDFFMDFFNSIRDAAQGAEVYTERRVIYPPLANLIFLALSRFTPNHYNDTEFSDRYTWPEYYSTMMLAVIFVAIFAICFFFIIYSNMENGSKYKRFAYAFLAFFSVPLLYMAERGNMIVFCMLALLIYAFTYNSENKWHREIGLIALSFAFALKLYPAIFGWFLIADKRFKDALKCVIYGALMIIIPSFFFGGPVCLLYVFQNIFSFSTKGSGSTIAKICAAINLPDIAATVINALAYGWVLVCGISFAISPFINKEKYKTWLLGLVTICCVPSLTSLYIWAFMIIPITMICAKKEHTRSDMLQMIFMTVPFVYIPFRFSYHVAPSIVLVYLMTAALSIWSVFDTFGRLRIFIAEKKQAGISAKQYFRSLVSK